MTPSIDQTLHQFANVLPKWTLIPILTLLPNFGGFHRTLQRVRLANRGRFLLTPGPVPFGTCICSNVETILSLTCHVYGPFEFRKSLDTILLVVLQIGMQQQQTECILVSWTKISGFFAVRTTFTNVAVMLSDLLRNLTLIKRSVYYTQVTDQCPFGLLLCRCRGWGRQLKLRFCAYGPYCKLKSDLKWCIHLSRSLCSYFNWPVHVRKNYVTCFSMYNNISLKLYCRYLYTRPCMINHIWGLKQLWLQLNGHAFFICNGSVDLFGTGRERKIQNENICLQRDSNPHPASPRQESCSALDRSATLVRYQVEHYSLTVFWNGYVTIPVWNRLWFDTQCKVL